jgi:hypothetical protein
MGYTMQKLFGTDIEPDFSMAKEQRSGQFKYVFWGGSVLVFVYAAFRDFDVRFIQVYVATVLCFGLTFYVNRGNYFSKPWLWKAILVSLPLHVLYLAAILWADKASPDGMTKPLVFIPALTLGCAIESSVFGAIADRFKPQDTKDESQALAD